MAGQITGAGIVEGSLVLSLSSGEIINCGPVRGPQGLTGERGATGMVGPKGLDGSSMLHGVGAPQFDTGRDNDFYYQTDKVCLFGPKENGQWGKPVYLRPEDNKSFTLPTGMKAQGGGGSSRAFSASVSGPGGVPVPGPAPTGSGLKTIIGHNKPFPAATMSDVAIDLTGDAMKVMIWAQSSSGTLFTEVAASKGSGSAGFTEIYDIRQGGAPTLTFNAVLAGAALTLQMSSDMPLSMLRGKVIYL